MNDEQLRRVAKRFWPRVDKMGDDDCWPWMGYRDAEGYGRYGSKGAHVVAFILSGGQLTGYRSMVDHQCHNADLSCKGGAACPHRGCVNPRHLRAVSAMENVHGALVQRRAWFREMKEHQCGSR